MNHLNTQINDRLSFEASLQARSRRESADKLEKETIIALFKDAVENPQDYTPVDWGYWDLELEQGSSLHQLHSPASDMLSKLLDSGHLPTHVVSRLGKPHDGAYVSSAGSIFIHGDKWVSITDYINNGRYKPQLTCLAEMASQTGGYVQTADKAAITQWLEFHGLDVPSSIAQTENLLKYLTTSISDADHLGNYWSQLYVTDETQIALTAAQQADVRKLTHQFLPTHKRLLDKLYEDALRSPAVNWDQAADLIKSLVSHPSSRILAKRYIDALGWYGAQAGETVDNDDLDQLLVTAILLDLNPFIGTQAPRSPFGTFDLYAPANVDLPHFLIREQLQAHLVSNERVSLGAAPLAAHLLLANVAPEFLVKALPSIPLVGSIAWVTYCRSVAIVESYAPGASRLMNAEQLEEYGRIEPISHEHARLCALATLNPIVNWALLNSVITAQEWQQSHAQALKKAMAAYQVFVEQLNQASTAFMTPLPTRQAVALAQLKRILPNCDYLEMEFLKPVKPDWRYQSAVPYAAREPLQNLRMSMVELHMSGELASQDWNGATIDVYKDNPSLLDELKTISVDYEPPLRDYRQALDTALVTNVKLALAQMDEHDQQALQRSDLTFYTVRPTAAFETDAPVALNGRLGSQYRMIAETQEVIDAAAGHYGVLISATQGDQTTWYELFGVHGKCLKNNRLGASIVGVPLQSLPARIAFNGDLKLPLPPAPLLTLPLDMTNYTHGSEPSRQTTSQVVLDKLGSLAAPASAALRNKGIYQRFQYPQFERIARFVAQHRPLASYAELKEVAKGQTKLEELLRENDERMEFVLNLIIPFRQCIQDLASGERVRVAQGVFGCIMDAISVIGGIVGSVSKIAGIMSRTVSSCAKIAGVANELVMLTIATFNPLDGLRSYGAMGTRLVFKGGMSLNRAGMEIVAKVRAQAHRLTPMTDSYDMIKASERADLAQGTWAAKDSSESATVWACRSGTHQWHAANRFGRPWGEKLQNFTRISEIRLPSLDKQLPLIYTRAFIENALSVASKKLDTAISALSRANKQVDTDQLAKLLLGNSGIKAANNVLMAQKSYNSAIGIGNFLLRTASDDTSMIVVSADRLQAWKNAGELKTDTTFIDVAGPDLNDRYRDSRFNPGVIADDLIRALLHTEADIVDLSHALPLRNDQTRDQKLDVAPLLNLATGHHPVADEGVPTRYHASSHAEKNAHSWSVFISLLDQLETDPATFARNLSNMRAAVERHRGGPVVQPVSIDLNTL